MRLGSRDHWTVSQRLSFQLRHRYVPARKRPFNRLVAAGRYDSRSQDQRPLHLSTAFKGLALTPREFADALEAGILDASQGNYESAIPNLSRLCDKFPDEPSCLSPLANSLIRSGRIAEAVRLFTSFVSRHPEADMVWVQLGDAYQVACNDYQALKSYRFAITVNDGNFWAQRNLGLLLFAIGSYEQAIGHLIFAAKDADHPQYSAELRDTSVSAMFYLRKGLEEIEERLRGFPTNSFSSVISENTWYATQSALYVSASLIFAEHKLGQLRSARLLDGTSFLGNLNVGNATINPRRYASVAQLSALGLTAYQALNHVPYDLKIHVEFDSGESHVISLQATIRTLYSDNCPSADRSACSLGDLYFEMHKYELAALYYAIAENRHERPNTESFSQCLSNLGRYHEAELVLEHALQEFELIDDDELGKVVDMYCTELARVALPGYQNKLAEICSRFFPGKEISYSKHTNRGHLKIIEQDMGSGLAEYHAASALAANRKLVHFSNGIHSAIPSPEKFEEPFSIVHWDQPENFKGFQAVHCFACDKVYFVTYAKSLIASSLQASDELVGVHVHVIDPDDESFSLLSKLREQWLISFSYEFHPADVGSLNVRTYYTCARFLIAPLLLRRFKVPVIVTETDCLISWSWSDILHWGGVATAGMHLSGLWSLVPWTKIPAGLLYLNATESGLKVADYISGYIETVLRKKGSSAELNLWTLDQFAIWRAWQEYQSEVDIVHFPMYSMLKLAVGDKTNVLLA